jgi:hypothetical protein
MKMASTGQTSESHGKSRATDLNANYDNNCINEEEWPYLMLLKNTKA